MPRMRPGDYDPGPGDPGPDPDALDGEDTQEHPTLDTWGMGDPGGELPEVDSEGGDDG